jgi:X-Pro dipeptidyl-peptidase C-terminal non-catalytic domain
LLQTEFTPFYLHADHSLGRAKPDYAPPPLAFRFDPCRPVPTIGGALSSGEPLMRGGAYDQREGPQVFGAREPYRALAERPDVLSFATPPLAQPLEVVGPVSLRLWETSDCPDTDFTAKLLDLYPPSPDDPEGFAMNLCEGLLRLRYRDSWEGAGADGVGTGVCDRNRAVSDRQPVFAGTSPAPRHFEQQLSAFRREPEFGRAGRVDGPSAGRAEPGFRRSRAALACTAAGNPDDPGLAGVAAVPCSRYFRLRGDWRE